MALVVLKVIWHCANGIVVGMILTLGTVWLMGALLKLVCFEYHRYTVWHWLAAERSCDCSKVIVNKLCAEGLEAACPWLHLHQSVTCSTIYHIHMSSQINMTETSITVSVVVSPLYLHQRRISKLIIHYLCKQMPSIYYLFIYVNNVQYIHEPIQSVRCDVIYVTWQNRATDL